MVRVITIAREFGSGGGILAQAVASHLGWKLLDNALLEQIAHTAKVDPSMARRFDESCDSWLHRIAKDVLWRAGLEGATTVTPGEFFDSEEMAHVARGMIETAAGQGECVIVGRGAQCILQGRRDVFHVYVYAPWQDKLKRVKQRMPKVADPGAHIREMDRRRTAYIRRYFQQNWCDPLLYDLMINMRCGEEAALRMVLSAVVTEKAPQ